MPSACFIDTNVLLYAKDPRAPTKQRRALEWIAALADRELAVISPQVLNEFAHNALRKLRHIGHDELRKNLEAMRPWCLAPVNDETALQGLAIHRRYRFSFYDSTLIAAALAYGCDVFLSEDLGHDQRLDGLWILDPFEVEPAFLLAER